MPVFPNTGGGGGGPVSPGNLPPNINGNLRCVSPNGNDSNAGDDWSRPLKYVKTAWNQLVALGGGTIYFADQSAIAANGKGLHIASQSDPPANSVAPAPIQVIGVGSEDFSGFTTFAPSRLIGGAADGSTDQDDPAIWISDAVNDPITFQNVATQRGLVKSERIGWDYTRDDDGEIIKNDVGAADRANGQTEFTVTPYTFDIDKISRVSNEVFVAYKLRTGQSAPIRAGMSVYVDFDGAEFDPVAAVVTSITFDASNTFNVAVIASTGVNFSTGTIGGPSIGTLATTLVTERDYITLYGGVTEFPASQYRVLSTDMTDETEGSITVTDYYGYTPRSATADDTDIGAYAAQDRLRHPAARIQIGTLFSASIVGDSKTEDFITGPTMDIGSLIFFDFSNFSVSGFNIKKVGSDYGCRDPERRAAILCDGGGGDSAIGFGALIKSWGGYGGIRYHGPANGSALVAFKNVIVDQPLGDWLSVPALDVLEMSNSSYLYGEQISMVDGQQSVPAVLVDPACQTGTVCIAGAYGGIDGPAIINGPGLPNLANDFPAMPNEQGQMGYYGENFNRILAGRHFSSARSGAPSMNALGANIAHQIPASWTTQNVTVTSTGIRDPFGGTRASRCLATGSGAFVTFRLLQGFTANTGDFWLGTVWMRRETGLDRALDMRITNIDQDVTYLSAHGYYPRAGGEAGNWEPVNVSGFLSGVAADETDTGVILQVNISNGEHVDVYLPSMWSSPVADRADKVTAAECAEIATHQAPAPGYLPAGMVGTPPGQLFIASGGFGTAPENAKTAGVGSGQLTLTGTGTVYLPMYADDGTTIIGWVAQLQATVNP